MLKNLELHPVNEKKKGNKEKYDVRRLHLCTENKSIGWFFRFARFLIM